MAPRDRATNLGLVGLLVIAFATGGLAYATGTSWGQVAVVAHGVAGLGVLALTPWKSAIARRGLARPRHGRSASVALAVVVAVAVISGVAHAGGARRLPPLTTMQWHVGAALVAVPLLVGHVLVRPVRPRVTDLSRRNVLRAGVLAAGTGAAWVGIEGIWRVAGLRGADRRFTGSHEVGSLEPRQMPVTQWLDDNVPRVDPSSWRLVVQTDGARRTLTLPDLRRPGHRDEVVAVLDCTGGWWSEQRWEGVALARLVPDADRARSILVRSVTGYSRRFPVHDIDALLLATHVGGEPLSPGHGAPARLVAPGRRGFWWVKWVHEIRLDDTPWWWQPPFPLT